MNITVDRKVIEQALEEWHTDPGSVRMASLMIALRTALEQPKQEPVAWMLGDKFYKVKQCRFFSKNPGEEIPGQIPLYAAPPQRKPLTEEQKEVLEFLDGIRPLDGVWFGEPHPTQRGFYWWRKHMHRVFDEAAHGIKGDA